MNPWQRTVYGLAGGETLVWASSYYLFPAMLPEWEADLGWSRTALAGAFTLALLVSAITSPLVGMLIDQGRGRQVLVASTGMLAILVALLGQVQSLWQFYVLWLCLGVAMAGALYDPCFAYLTQRFGSAARRAITRVTLVAGFAGTLAFPGVQGLSAWLGWRGACGGFALMVAGVALPLMWLATRAPTTLPTPPTRRTAAKTSRVVLLNPIFWYLALAFAMIALNHGVLITHLLPLLDAQGVATAMAVLAASLIGPMQVLGRLLMLAVERKLAAQWAGVVLLLCLLGASSVLLMAGNITGLILGFVVLQGSGYGINSIIRPVITAEFLGYRHFGTLSGVQSGIVMAANALAATVGAFAWHLGGYRAMLSMTLGFAVVGLVALLLATYHRSANQETILHE